MWNLSLGEIDDEYEDEYPGVIVCQKLEHGKRLAESMVDDKLYEKTKLITKR